MLRTLGLILACLLEMALAASAGEWKGSFGNPPVSYAKQGDGPGVGGTTVQELFSIIHGGSPSRLESGASCFIRAWDYRNFTCSAGSFGNNPCVSVVYFFCPTGTVRVSGCRCAGAGTLPVNEGPSSCKASPRSPNPVEFATGTKMGRFVDFSSGGQFPLQFVRNYSSNNSTVIASTEFDAGLLGRGGWLTDYDARLAFQNWTAGSSTPPGNNTKAVMRLPTGGQMAWVYQSSPNKWVPGYVSYAASGSIVIGAAGNGRKGVNHELTYSGGQFFVRMPDDRTFVFSNLGTLLEIRWPGAYKQVMNSGGHSVLDSYGRFLDFTLQSYDTRNYIKKIVSSSGFELNYEYAHRVKTDANTLAPADPAPAIAHDIYTLSAVVFPDSTPTSTADNPKVQYHYENLTHEYALTGITDERGVRVATYVYDTFGRVINEVHADTTDSLTIAYDDLNKTRTVTNAYGKQTVYQYEDAIGSASALLRLKSVNGVASTNCVASNSTQT